MMEEHSMREHSFVVTGAASGIGQATAAALVRLGARVIALDRVQPSSPVDQFIAVDLANPESISAASSKLPTGLAGLLNIAGVPGTVAPETLARVNYLGLRMLTDATLPKIRRGGAVVSVASTAGENWRDNLGAHLQLAATDTFAAGLDWITRHDWPRERAYAWFKEALIVWVMAKSASIRAKHEVRITTVSPGPVDTPILDNFRTSLGPDRVAEAIRRGGGAADPRDIAEAIVLLASPAARWIVGTNLVVDGGVSASRLEDTNAEVA
jgi:NAD(P)-dependent dehydrogenase (short-subunit alcohol dehydrogenase family)